jgi:glycosyltransferase involved in cell wall biosynthesis
MPVTLALSTLCENPRRRTGLSTLFQEFIRHALHEFPDVRWVVFAGADEPWAGLGERVKVCRDFPSNERPLARLFCDHFRVAARAKALGARALFTVGFAPMATAGLPILLQVFVLPGAGGGLRGLYRRAFVTRGLRMARLVIVNSEWARSRLGSDPARTLVSPEGLQHDRFRPDGQKGLPGRAGPYFLWSSNFYAYKRCELALAAYAALPKAMRDRCAFRLIGGDWGGRRSAEAAARRLGVADRVEFLGWVPDAVLPALYRGAVAHVLSSAEETFGRSVLEAMACGCVNVIQDLPVFKEVAGEAALYVDFADPIGAAAALERAWRNEEAVQQLRAQALSISAQFSFPRLARERVGRALSVATSPS